MSLINLSWSSFPGPLADGDIIQSSIQNGAAAAKDVEIVLTAGRTDMWWKAIMFTDASGNTTEIWTASGKQQSGTMVRPAYQMKGATLEFKKAKAVGVHTGMYSLPDLDAQLKAGTRVTFIWASD
jgi:hypothetical protein